MSVGVREMNSLEYAERMEEATPFQRVIKRMFLVIANIRLACLKIICHNLFEIVTLIIIIFNS